MKFLREHDSNLDDRTVHDIFETLNTFLRTRDILIAGKILAELDYAEKPPKPYTKQELKDMFAAMDEEEKLLYGLFLNSGVRDAEMQNTEYADFNWEKCTLRVHPKPWRKFRLKGKSKKKSAKDGEHLTRQLGGGCNRLSRTTVPVAGRQTPRRKALAVCC